LGEVTLYSQFYKQDAWYDINDFLVENLELDVAKVNLQVFADPHIALMDILFGLARQYMIKRKVFYFANTSPYLERPLQFLSMQSYELKALKYPDDLKDLSWLDQVDNTCLAVILPTDFPFLPKYHDHTGLVSELNSKRVFSIKLSNSYYGNFALPLELPDFAIEINTLGVENCFALVGRRAKSQPIFTMGMNWSKFDQGEFLSRLQSPLPKEETTKNKVLNFEKQAVGESQPVCDISDLRYYDRAAIYWEDLDATAVVEILNESESLITTPSLTTWGGLRTMKWLNKLGYSPSQIRGMLIIAADLLSDEFEKKLAAKIAKIKELQGCDA